MISFREKGLEIWGRNSWAYFIESCYYISLISILWTLEYCLNTISRQYLVKWLLIQRRQHALTLSFDCLRWNQKARSSSRLHLVAAKSQRREGISVLTVELLLLFSRLLCNRARSLLLGLVVLPFVSVLVPPVVSAIIIPVVSPVIPSVGLRPSDRPTSAATTTFALSRPIRSESRKSLADLLLAQFVVNINSVFQVVLGPVELKSLDLIQLPLDALIKLWNLTLQLFKLLAFCDCGVSQKSRFVL